ncbi:hypothetical protein [Bradyrhizobium sp. sGM-13]|uniref:hypothetical protein n=1 Tax=Bradyrhizobium sp. sGM-13 TaxID=2831781 RepID=UPI001BD12767|nr:hypothetical protein [Bradyrhizobium sp. sGM-13]
MRDKLSGIFLIPGLDTISENQKSFARRVALPQSRIEISLGREANQFAVCRVGKAIACPPSLALEAAMVGTLRFAQPTVAEKSLARSKTFCCNDGPAGPVATLRSIEPARDLLR